MTKSKSNSSFTGELTAGEVASQSGVSVSAIQFYESKKLIDGRRTVGNRRRYPREVLKRVILIRAAQSVGIPLSLVHEMFTVLPREEVITEKDWQLLLDRLRIDLDERLTRLVGLRRYLTSCIGCGCLLLDACPLVAPTDVAANLGAAQQLTAKSVRPKWRP